MLQPDEIRHYSQLSSWKPLFWLALDWGIIMACFAIYIHFPNIWVYLLAVILIARTQLALAIILHDGSHKRLNKNPVWNDYLGQFLAAGPILFSMFSYRNNHIKHHRDPLVEDDPDITLIGGYPIPLSSFIRKLLRDISGLSYFKFIKYFLYSSHKRSKQIRNVEKDKGHDRSFRMPLWQVILSVLLSNGIILGSLIYLGHGLLYLTMWILPAVTILQVLLRVRGIAEHAGYGPNKDQRLNSRTVVNPFQAFFFAPHNVNYHIEHHLYVGVPFYNLPKIHKLMHERGSLPEKNFYTSYGQVVRELIE